MLKKYHFPVITSTSKQSLKWIGHGVETLIKSLFKWQNVKMFLKEVSYVHQSYIFIIKNTIKK